MEYIKLKDLCEKEERFVAPNDDAHIDYVDISSVDNKSKSFTKYDTYIFAEAPSRARKRVKHGDVIVSTVRPNLNAVARFNIQTPHTPIASTGFCVLRHKSDVDPIYIYFFCISPNFVRQMVAKATGASYPAVSDAIVREAKLPKHTAEKRVRIVSTLSKAKEIIEHRRAQLAKLDELVKCRFVEMFGDMIYNPNKWDEKALQSVADIVSGITKGRKISDTKLIEVPYMSVCNVKDGYIDWTNLKTILATNKEIEQYRILANDVLMTEGGDPDKVGRGAIISSPPSNCIHQNHIFRVRLSEEVEAIYFEQYLQQPKARQYFYRSAKQTTGIASINMSQLKAMPVLLPPLALQEQFADFVQRIDKLRFVIQQSLDEAQKLFDSLMQEYFD